MYLVSSLQYLHSHTSGHVDVGILLPFQKDIVEIDLDLLRE